MESIDKSIFLYASEMVEGHAGNEFEDQEEDQDEIQQTTTATLPVDPSTSSGITPTGVFNTGILIL